MNEAIKFLFHKVDLTNKAVYSEFIEYVHYSVKELDRAALFDLTEFITNWLIAEPNFETSFPNETKELRRLATMCAWLTLPMHKNDFVLDLFQNDINCVFEMPLVFTEKGEFDFTQDVFERQVREWLLNTSDFDERDELKKEVIKRLLQSGAVITGAQFFEAIKEVKPTVGNWLAEYEAYALKKYNAFTLRRFLLASENVKRLNTQEKQNIEELCKLHNRLYTSSWSPIGMEEPISLNSDSEPEAIINYGELVQTTKEQQEQFITSMKTIKNLYEESGIEVPSTLDWLDNKAQERPPVQLPTKGALSEIGGGPAVDTLEGPDHFTEQDALDIQQHTALIDDLVHSTVDYDAQAQQLITRMELVFTSADIEQAVKQLIVSVLRGLRDTMELRTYLEQHNFEATQIDQVIAVLKAALYKRAEAVIDATPIAPVAPTTPTVTEAAISSADQSQRSASQSTTDEAKHGFLPKLRRARVAKKPIIDDVKLQQSMVMGPIDELRAMDVLEFRRLSDNPAAAAQKIKTKIDLLAEESISKQAEGVEAWRASIINGIYVATGNESISSGKSVAEVITEWKAAGKSVITEDEFSAIADINQQLRF